jgi:hypothetical protein
MDSVKSNLPHWAAVGAEVRVKRTQWKDRNPVVWKQMGQIVNIEKDTLLTQMNRVGMVMHRVVVRWPDGETASLLPVMLEPFPSSAELETKEKTKK